MQCNDGLGRAIEEMSNRTNRANQLMLIFLAQCYFFGPVLIFWASAKFRPFYNLFVFDTNSSCLYAYFRRFNTLFGAYFHRAKSALELIFTPFACLINWTDFPVPLYTFAKGAPVGSQVGAENVGEHPKHRVLLLAALSNNVDSEREFWTLDF